MELEKLITDIKNIKDKYLDIDIHCWTCFEEGMDTVIGDTIKLIKEAIPQSQLKPKDEGWYWFEAILVQTAWDLSVHYLSKDVYGNLIIPRLNGKWYKAILPISEVTI